ncbi:hypothetical protein [Micromonospora coxensis]|uniref:hypothetical protein n=1 Tax=Micromonospora coxensis TaxID=356852 RepID=UPI0034355D97
MNDLQLLDTHGPAAQPLRPETLDRARAALLAEIGTAVALPSPTHPVRRRARRRWWAAAPVRRFAMLAAGVAALGLAAPLVLSPDEAQAVVLVEATAITFPLSPGAVPAGLGRPVFEKDENFQLAMYVGEGTDRISVVVPDDRHHWDVPGNARTVDVAGQAGRLFSDDQPEDRSVSLVWQERGGRWVGVTGRGSYADPARVEAFAESLQGRPQPVPLRLSLAPRGWFPSKYKSTKVVTYAPRHGDREHDTLDVILLDALSEDLAGDYGATEVSGATVHGLPAITGRIASGWVVEARTPEGQAYSVLAPGSFTREQLIQVAEGVRYAG